ncbi:MAG: DUF2300 domain-containing protein [Bdellovibrionales bacterium]|nr:DUF2300 domain-containing protein [Bdellovibrionales bacterium]
MVRKLQLINLLIGIHFLLLGTSANGSELLFIKEGSNGNFEETVIVKKNRKITSSELRNLEDNKLTKLGSLWKIFSYVYLIEQNQTVTDYQCSGKNVEEKFCCERGSSINMDMALVKSCGLFFSPSRVQIDPVMWESFWGKKIESPYPWLVNYQNLNANTEVSIKELLMSLKKLRFFIHNRERLENTLSRVTVAGTGKQGLINLGTTLKFKTFTWNQSGGLAGWGADGNPFFAKSSGKSSDVLSEWSAQIAKFMNVKAVNISGEMVKVKFFAQYPIKDIQLLDSSNLVKDGVLKGNYLVKFINGNHIEFHSNGQLSVNKKNNQIQIFGKFSIDEYVARVIEREITPKPIEAAKAFSILIRTYLLNNSHKSFNYFEIDDSSRFQRVSVSPPSKEALNIARWGHDLILKNTPDLTYHSTEDGPHRLSWAKANTLAKNNEDFLSILKNHYDINNLGLLNDANDQCSPLVTLQKWVDNNKKKWQITLSQNLGFSIPKSVKVCQSNNGKQYADLENDLIYVNFQNNSEDFITTAHEFLHLAYKNHPVTNNEEEIEARAKKIVLNLEERI